MLGHAPVSAIMQKPFLFWMYRIKRKSWGDLKKVFVLRSKIACSNPMRGYNKKTATRAGFERVPLTGPEPAMHCCKQDFKSYVSANFTTRALTFGKVRTKKIPNSGERLEFIWSRRRDSNARPQPWQGCALPAELLLQLL